MAREEYHPAHEHQQERLLDPLDRGNPGSEGSGAADVDARNEGSVSWVGAGAAGTAREETPRMGEGEGGTSERDSSLGCTASSGASDGVVFEFAWGAR